MTQEERYRMALAARHNAQGEGVKDFSGPLAPGVGREKLEEAYKNGERDLQNNAISPVADAPAPVANVGQQMGAQTAQAGAQSGSMMGTAGGAMMMSGNPYLMAGGLGLTVLAAGEENKRKQEEAERQAYNERIKQRQMAMSQIAQMGIQ